MLLSVSCGSLFKPTECRCGGCGFDCAVGSPFFGHPPAGTVPYPLQRALGDAVILQSVRTQTLWTSVWWVLVLPHDRGREFLDTLHRKRCHTLPRIFIYGIGLQSVRGRTLRSLV